MRTDSYFVRFKAINFLTLMFIFAGFLLTSCGEGCENTYSYWTSEPVYFISAELRSAVKSESPRPIKNPGKIYAKGYYIFVNEIDEGIHVINNRNPAAPINTGFIKIPGNNDIAVRNNTLYADSYIDLVALDITNPQNIKEINRLENVFPYYNYTDSVKGMLVDYKPKLVTQTIPGDCNTTTQPTSGPLWGGRPDVAFSSADKASGGSGVGGSMARFTIYDHYLYTVNNSALQLFDITSPASPEKSTQIDLGWGIETIFPYQDKLFIGSQRGMYIYDNKNPSHPEHLSTYEHIQSCDPVVVQGDYAYVTLRAGNFCRAGVNQLDVVDISNLREPRQVKAYPMQNPHGLGVNNNTLFLCEGQYGLKVFDIRNPRTIDSHQLAHFTDMDTYDVIPLPNTLLVIGKDGLYQYDYNTPQNLKLLSKISVVKD